MVSSSNVYAYNVKGTSSSAVGISAGSSGTEITLGLDSNNKLYDKLNGTLNTTLNNHWASGTNNKAIDGNFYIIATGTGEGHNLDLDFLKTELKVDAGQADNAILASTFQEARTTTSAPTTVRLVLLGKEEATQTLNTDTVFSISRNNGSNFSAVTMAESGTYNSSGVKIYTGTVDVSSQPSGTQIVLKITSTLNKRFTIHGYSLLYK